MVERQRRGDGSGGNERYLNGERLAVPQMNGGTTEAQSENLSLDMRNGRETEMAKRGSLISLFDANEIWFAFTENVSNGNNLELYALFDQ